ncbi:nuclear transport factor 2 family protein [Streptomyces albiaxialis]|uniref:Nuclear transport factor 2 family protein n=1 Tax=Streptomyces albiaxialis TaxID=329523 RepID=A0ABN2WAP6_9ACTN
MTIEHSTESVAVLTGMYAAEAAYMAAGGPGKADFSAMAPYFAPDAVLHQAQALPYGGVWRGHEGIEACVRAMAGTWETFAFVRQEFLGTGPTAVVLTEVHARSRATGREIDFPILQTATVTDGRITDIRPYYWDTAAIARTCGREAGSL